MRFIVLALILSACSAYPATHWPEGSGAVAAPALLPQAGLAGPPVAGDPGAGLVARAGDLRRWAATPAP